jgi:hypothetical protein
MRGAMRWGSRSPITPEPKSQYFRQRKKYSGLHGRFFAGSSHVAAVAGLGPEQPAEVALLHDLLRALPLGLRAGLGAEGDAAVVLLRVIEDLERLLEVQRHRLLHVDMEAGLQGVTGEVGVGVVGRRDDEGVELCLLDHVFEVGEDLVVAQLGRFLGLVAGLVPDVADRRDLDVGVGHLLHDVPDVAAAHALDPDDAGADAVVGADDLRIDHGGRGDPLGSGQEGGPSHRGCGAGAGVLEEVPTGEVGTVRMICHAVLRE